MKDLIDKVAVITGAASGIGKGLASQFAQEGVKIVLADIEECPLMEAERDLRARGAQTLAVVTDVSKRDSVFALANRAFDTFGNVHVLCNNAGVSGGIGLSGRSRNKTGTGSCPSISLAFCMVSKPLSRA